MKKYLVGLLLLLWGFSSAQETRVFVFLNSKPDKAVITEEETAELMKQHLANIEKLVTEGKLLVAGPFEGGGGIFIFNTGDVEQTKKWLQSDPAIRANRWNIEVLRIDFLKGGACLAMEPYEMITYGFARVSYIHEIANYKIGNTEVAGWSSAAAAPEVISVGQFPGRDGGIVIYKETGENVWNEDFGREQVALEKKKLWVAKGSFCE